MHRGAAAGAVAPARLPGPARAHGRPARRTARCRTWRSRARRWARSGRELRHGGYDVVHVHEPNAPFVSWFATEAARVPLVGTFHCYSRSPLANGVAANVGRRPPPLQQAATCGSRCPRRRAGPRERFYGGRYRIVPNGVDLAAARPDRPRRPTARSSCCSSAAPRRARACPCCCAPSRRCAAPGVRRPAHRGRRHRGGGRAAAARPGGRARGRPRDRGGEVAPAGRGRPARARRRSAARASAWCSPRRSPPRTPVVASDIAGYRDVVRDGVRRPAGARRPTPPRSARRCATWRSTPPAARAMAAAARERAERFAWPRVTDEVLEAYERRHRDARAREPAPAGARRLGLRRRGEPGPPPPARLPSHRARACPRTRAARRAVRVARRAAVVGAGRRRHRARRAGARPHRHRVDRPRRRGRHARVGARRLRADVRLDAHPRRGLARDPARRPARAPACAAATPPARTMIGVLMSATLPARLGEPSRALIVARRVGPGARPLPGGARHAGLADPAQPARAGDPRRGDVRHRRHLPRRRGRAGVRHDRAGRGASLLLLAAPALLRRGKPSRFVRVQQALAAARRAMVQVRTRPAGLPPARGSAPGRPPRSSPPGPSSGSPATCCWWRSGLDEQAGIGAAAAVLFAVNVTAALPATPSNLGVFQAACVAVLSAYGVGHDRRAGLRDHPAGGRDRDRAGDGHARAGARGHDLEGPAPARAARHAGGAGAASRARGDGRGLAPQLSDLSTHGVAKSGKR